MSDLLTLFLLIVVAIGCLAFGFFCAVELSMAMRSRDWESVIVNVVLLILASCSMFSVLSMSVL